MTHVITHIIACLISAQPFQIHTYEDVGQDTHLLIYNYSTQDPPAILVYDKTMLKIFDHWNKDTYRNFLIPKNTLAFDVFDINNDAILDCIFLLHDHIQIQLSGKENHIQQDIPLQDSLDWDSNAPAPTTLVTRHKGEWVFSIHHTDTLHLYTLEGIPITKIIPPSSKQNTLAIIPVFPPQIASQHGLEFRIDTTWAQSYDYQGRPDDIDHQETNYHLTQRMLQEAASKEPEEWPWFPLQPATENPIRILAAKAAPDYRNTYIRFQRPEKRNLPTIHGKFNFSPKRLFPGNLLLQPSGLPDVNADGYSDLLFWSIPPPGATVSKLLRGAQSGKWTIRFTIHLYDPTQEIFHPRPSSRIKLDIPLAWIFLNPGRDPIRNLVFADLDSDGDSDLICSTDDRTISAWLYNNGFKNKPDYTVKFDESIELIHWDTMGDEDTVSMLVRSDTSLYLLTLP